MTYLLIRNPAPEEYASVHALVQKVVDETYGGLWAQPPLTIDEEDWAQSHVAIVDGRIVGMVLTRNQWIDDLWVLRESRGQGIGRELLAKGESEIAARGYRTFRLRVVKSNRAAVDFYRKNGWQAAREFPHEKLSVAMLEMTKSDFPETSSGAPPQRQGRS